MPYYLPVEIDQRDGQSNRCKEEARELPETVGNCIRISSIQKCVSVCNIEQAQNRDSLHEIYDLPQIRVAFLFFLVRIHPLRALPADVTPLQCPTVDLLSELARWNQYQLTCSVGRRIAARESARSIVE